MEHAQEVMANAVSHLVRVKGQVAHLQSGLTPNQQLSEEVGCLCEDLSLCMSLASVSHHQNNCLYGLACGKMKLSQCLGARSGTPPLSLWC